MQTSARTIFIGVAAMALLTLSPFVSWADNASGSIRGKVSQITKKAITLNGKEYRYSANMTCTDHRRVRMGCQTLFAVGYVDEAIVTLSAGQVVQVDVIELQQ